MPGRAVRAAAGVMFAIGLFILLAAPDGAAKRPAFRKPPIAGQGKSGPVPDPRINVRGRIFKGARLQSATVIAGVPAYLWRYGSAPSAAAMVLAYYDTHGYPDLLPGDGAVQSDAINLAIASPEHYADYCLPLDSPPTLLPDKSELPVGDEHINNCLADGLFSSQSFYDNYYGWAWSADLRPGIQDFVNAASSNYTAIVTEYLYQNFEWSTVRNEIRSNRPLIFFVDTEGDGEPDHFVTVIGVNTAEGVDYFGCYNTWDRDIHWYPRRTTAVDSPWGISNIITVFMTIEVFPPRNFALNRLVSDYIFFKEYINRLTWEANPKNETPIARYKLFRKRKEDPDATYALLAETDGETFLHDDRGLRENDAYAYRIVSVDEAGHESKPVSVSHSGGGTK